MTAAEEWGAAIATMVTGESWRAGVSAERVAAVARAMWEDQMRGNVDGKAHREARWIGERSLWLHKARIALDTAAALDEPLREALKALAGRVERVGPTGALWVADDIRATLAAQPTADGEGQ